MLFVLVLVIGILSASCAFFTCCAILRGCTLIYNDCCDWRRDKNADTGKLECAFSISSDQTLLPESLNSKHKVSCPPVIIVFPDNTQVKSTAHDVHKITLSSCYDVNTLCT